MSDNVLQASRFTYLDIAKGIGILLVVIGHCIPDASTSEGISIWGYKVLFNIIYSFHMPLFFFIAGFFLSRESIVKKGQTKLDVVIARAKRLLVPYFFVGMCYAPLKILFSRFANKPYDLANLWKIVIGVNPDGELWFLYALVVIVVIAAICHFKITLPLLAVSALLIFLPSEFTIVTGNLFYFFLGMYVRNEKCTLVNELPECSLYITFIFFCLGNLAMMYFNFHVVRVVTALAGIALTLIISNRIANADVPQGKVLETLGVFSMDIYILSDIVKIPFRIVLWSKLHLYTLSFLVCTIMAVLLSYLISKYGIRKNKLLKKLVLGMD